MDLSAKYQETFDESFSKLELRINKFSLSLADVLIASQ